ncbi:MAG: multiheme c-type cytochrome [Polyangiaceae bacterium]
MKTRAARAGAFVLLVGAGVLGVASASADGALPLPGPAPRHREAAAAQKLNDGCVGCHAEIGAEWKASMHAAAYEDPVFKKAYAIEPLGFCRNCHAPEGDPDAGLSDEAAALGVGCVTCHVQNDEIVGAHGSPGKEGVHPTTKDARLATADACAGCHEFDFPDQPGKFMQGTIGEHARSKFAKTACADCHMAKSGAHLDHRFRVAGDAKTLRSAVKVRAARPAPDTVRLTFTADHVGHDFPTGDMFRRLELRAVAKGPKGDITAVPTFLRREFRVGPMGGASRRVQVGDSRVPGDGSAVDAEIRFADDVTGLPVHWVVAYQRMDRGLAALFEVDMDADEILVAEGDL